MLKTFKNGGIHPPDHKLTANVNIERLDIPAQVKIPLSQHLGAPSEAIVKKGDQVKTGQLIAQSKGFVSANIHSPVTGKIEKIDQVIDSSGYRKPAIIIKTEEKEEWEEGIITDQELDNNIEATAEEIIQKVNKAGIVGLGGATFPSHVKLSTPPDKKTEILIINGVECEPYLTADHRVMLEKTGELLTGIEIAQKALGVNKAIIGIENNKPDAIEHLQKHAQNHPGIEIAPLKVKYPQGGEKQLIKAIIGAEVPPGGLPVDVGAVVFNVGTTIAIYEAVQKNKPLIERVVTITGKSLKKPSNFLVRIGTPIQDLIDAAGGLPSDTGKIINGGPMMGKAVLSTDIPVVKGSSGILLIQKEEAGRPASTSCIRCSRCLNVCPMNLEPYLLIKLAENDKCEELEANRTMDCVECGSCSYTCPANLPLLDFIRFGKSQVVQLKKSRKE